MTKRQRRRLLRERRHEMRMNYLWNRDWAAISLADPADFDGVILGDEGVIDRFLVVRR